MLRSKKAAQIKTSGPGPEFPASARTKVPRLPVAGEVNPIIKSLVRLAFRSSDTCAHSTGDNVPSVAKCPMKRKGDGCPSLSVVKIRQTFAKITVTSSGKLPDG